MVREGKEDKEMNKKIKKIIAREGLLFLGVVSIIVLIVLGNEFVYQRHIKNRFPNMTEEEILQYPRYQRYNERVRTVQARTVDIVGVLYSLYFVVRFVTWFVAWAIRTLRDKK